MPNPLEAFTRLSPLMKGVVLAAVAGTAIFAIYKLRSNSGISGNSPVTPTGTVGNQTISDLLKGLGYDTSTTSAQSAGTPAPTPAPMPTPVASTPSAPAPVSNPAPATVTMSAPPAATFSPAAETPPTPSIVQRAADAGSNAATLVFRRAGSTAAAIAFPPHASAPPVAPSNPVPPQTSRYMGIVAPGQHGRIA